MCRALLALTVVVVVAAVAVGSALGAQPFRRHVVHGQGVSLAVPASWIALERGIPQALVDRLSQQNPKLAPYFVQLARPGSPMKFLALDPAVEDGFATNVNVVVVPVAAGTTFATYRASVVAELQALTSGEIVQRVVEIGRRRALRVSYRFRIALGRTRTVQTLQYAFLRGARSIVVTYTTLPGQAARYARTFQQSAGSIRISG